MTTRIGNSNEQIDLATYGGGNPFYVGSGTQIVTASGSGIYGGTGQTWTLTNAGTIESTAAYEFGIDLHAAGLIANQASGLIEGFSAGIYITGGSGTILNEGTIAGTGRGAAGADFSLLQTQTVTNLGLIEGTKSGVSLFEPLSGMAASGAAHPATIVNQTGGTLAGGQYGLTVGTYGFASVSNAGTIEGGQDGVALFMRLGLLGSSAASPSGGGTIDNAAGAKIEGGRYGIAEGAGGTAAIVNDGRISGGVSGVSLFIGRGFVASSAGNPAGRGNIDNEASGTISGGVYGIVGGPGADGTITNAGRIEGGRAGISLFMGPGLAASAEAKRVAAGVLTNLPGGEISGGRDGVIIGGAATLINRGGIWAEQAGGVGVDFIGYGDDTLVDAGVIAGPGGAVQFGAGNDLLIVEPGALFWGNVDGGGGTNTLELAATPSPHTLHGVGVSDFTHFQHLTVEAGGAWILAGPARFGLGSQVDDEGSLTLTGTAVLDGSLSGGGSLGIGTTARVTLDGSVGSGLTIAFGARGVLALGDPAGFAASISDFAAGDAIDVTARDFGYGEGESVTFTQHGATGTLTLTDGSQSLNLTLFGQYAAGGFQIAADGHGGTLITYAPPPLRLATAPH